MDTQDIDQIILNYLLGKATPKETEILKNWINEDKDHKAIFESIKQYWESSFLDVRSSSTEAAYQKLKARSGSNEDKKVGSINFNSRRRRRSKIWYEAAAVFIGTLIVFGLVYLLHKIPNTPSNDPVYQAIIKENPKGQKLTTYLPDGSKVTLNSQSKIIYNNPFINGKRYVLLIGEAFFEVKSDSTMPFVVQSNDVKTVALGTSFNVKSRNESTVEVVLLKGKVKVSKDDDDKYVLLSPGKSATVTGSGEYIVEDFNYMEKVGWKDGVLVFKDNSLSEVRTKLENWYGVTFIDFEDLDDAFHYTGNYSNEPLEVVLSGISFVHDFQFEINGDTVKLIKN